MQKLFNIDLSTLIPALQQLIDTEFQTHSLLHSVATQQPDTVNDTNDELKKKMYASSDKLREATVTATKAFEVVAKKLTEVLGGIEISAEDIRSVQSPLELIKLLPSDFLWATLLNYIARAGKLSSEIDATIKMFCGDPESLSSTPTSKLDDFMAKMLDALGGKGFHVAGVKIISHKPTSDGADIASEMAKLLKKPRLNSTAEDAEGGLTA